jgi:hypothetical protein
MLWVSTSLVRILIKTLFWKLSGEWDDKPITDCHVKAVLHGGGALQNVGVFYVLVIGLQHVLHRRVEEQHANVLRVDLSQGAKNRT